jgi:hypothetical protein
MQKKTLSRPIQTDIELEEMEIFDELKDKSSNLEDKNDALHHRLREKERIITQLQTELDHKNQEVQLLIR